MENVLEGDELRTDLVQIEESIRQHGASNVLCVMTTTSCFAPRGCDRVVQVAEMCDKYNIGHIINNAYGLQSSKCCHVINQAFRTGRVDAIIQSTDKNFMVPVGGAIICGPKRSFIDAISQLYAGRASMAPTLDLLITMLYMGRSGYRKALEERTEMIPYLVEKLKSVAEEFGERVLVTPNNQISFGMTLKHFAPSTIHGEEAHQGENDPTFLGSMLFKRCVSGTRVITGQDTKTIGTFIFQGYGAHSDTYPVPYLTAACAMGITRQEIDTFAERLSKCLRELRKKKAHSQNL